jgi:DNA repair protein RadD
MQTLRPYQTEAIEQLRTAMVRHKRTILCVPTGGGKTTIVAEMIRRAIGRGKSILFLAHRSELLQQAVERLQGFGLEPGIVQGKHVSHNPNLNVASVQTLRNRPNGIFPPDIIFIDECHLSMANSYLTILERYPNAYVIGMTATPCRLDGKPLGDIYSKIVNPISIVNLTDNKFLVPVKAFGVKDSPQTDDIKTARGDFDNAELYKRYDKPQLYAGVVRNYIRFACNKPFICFCVNVDHSIKTAEEFRKQGIAVEHVDGTTNETMRNHNIAMFRAGLIQGICNVGLFTEGFDVPHVECVILNRATQSLALFLQMVGRGLRPYANKAHCTVIDHGENIFRHGWHDIDREWSLNPTKKKKSDKIGAMSVKLCDFCEFMMPVNTAVCENCGHEHKKKEKQVLEAEFAELVRTPTPAHLRKKWSDMNEAELREYAKLRNYKDGWVRVQLKLRNHR